MAQASCANCGRAVPDSARFCPHCGERPEANPGVCAQCGSRVTPGGLFCPNCGAAAAGPGPPRVVEAAIEDRPDIEYMGFWIRVVASIIDSIIVSLIQVIFTFIGIEIISIFFGLLYGVLFIGLKGQTPGKMALGIAVVNAQGNVPGIGRAIIREIPGKLISTVVILLGYVWVARDRRKRGWHDYLAGTFVVRKERRRD